jgi:hypothetical protein
VNPTPGGETGAPAAPGSGPLAIAPGTARSPASCAPYAYSDVLKLCYDQNTGYVYDDAQGRWAQPFVIPQCAPYVFWPLINGCYDVTSGYGYDPARGWVYVGTDYELDTGADESGCSITRASSTSSAMLGVGGIAFGVLVLGSLRRRRSARP